MHTVDRAEENFKKLCELFPNAITETKNENGEVVRAIDADVLRQEISSEVVEGSQERYQFTWPDKKKSVVLANQPIAKTLRLEREKSVGRDGTVGSIDTENIYIEGDNLDALKLLQETYLGKVKMIYIDPPYNTGNDFVYEDDFSQDKDEYITGSGQLDEQGRQLVQNPESNGRFHTDWLNMLYPRLRIARDLLSDDGVIFISIDDNEQENLKKICDEIFGANNFVGNVIWERAFAPKNDAKYLSESHDFIIIYSKKIEEFVIGKLERTDEANARYKNPDNDPRGVWTPDNLTVKTYSASNDYPIKTPSGRIVNPSHGSCWRVSKQRFEELIADNRIYFGDSGNNVPRLKRFLSEIQNGMTATTIWKFGDVGHNQEGRQELKQLFDGKGYFDGPKPVRLLRRILQIANVNSDDIILDFFSGSATTAHAVIQQNAQILEKMAIEDEWKYAPPKTRFIMIQLPEPTDEKSEARKAGYNTICDIGEERIRRAGKQIKEELQKKNDKNKQLALKNNSKFVLPRFTLDIGFRVFRVDSSNMQNVYYSPAEYKQEQLELIADNIKPDRTPTDLLFQVMLDLGITLSSPIDEIQIDGKNVFSVADGYLIACFDTDIGSVIKEVIYQKYARKNKY